MQNQLNEEFIEKYSEQFAAKISKDFYTSHSHINGQEILNVSPSKQVNFFILKLLFNNWQQESQRLESPFFNYGAPDVKEALLQFMNVLSRFIKVERKEFEQLLQDAIRDTLFLIMAPNVYLEIEFDRKRSEELTDRVARNILKYIKIAKPDFTRYFQANIGIDKDDLEIDEAIITDSLLEEEIAKLNQVLPLTLKKLEDGDDQEVAEDLLSVEAEDLLSPTIARASETKEKTDVDETTPDESAPEEENIKSTRKEEIESPPKEEQEEGIMENEEVIEAEENKPNDEEDSTEPPPTQPSQASILTNMAPGEDDDTLNDKFEDPLASPTIAESHEGQEDSMMAAISVNHRYMFINELFDGEADRFTEAISKVEACTSFDESVEILVQNYTKEYHWDMNSDEVKELLKIIFRRFR